MEIEKNFLPQYKLYECTIYDDGKPTLSNIHFSNGYALASNGFIAVKASINLISIGFSSIELSYLEGKSIDARSFRTILGYPHVTITEKGFEIDDDEHPLFFGFNRQQSLRFPDVDNLVDLTRKNLVNGEAVIATGISGKFFAKLLKAMNAVQVRLDFNGTNAILVRKINCPEEETEGVDGIIMPIMID